MDMNIDMVQRVNDSQTDNAGGGERGCLLEVTTVRIQGSRIGGLCNKW